MPRPRLTDEERLARKKERSRVAFSDASYKRRYDTSTGYGSPEEWIRAAEAMMSGNLLIEGHHAVSEDLEYMMLSEMPKTAAAMKKAFHNALFVYHPDYGGSDDAVRKLLTIYEKLTKNFKV
jgi:hypothetical protein